MSTFADAPELTTTTVATPTATPSLRASATAAPSVVANGTGASELAEDGYPKDLEIPIRYVKGMEGDMVEARRRWIATLKVRNGTALPLMCCPAAHFFGRTAPVSFF